MNKCIKKKYFLIFCIGIFWAPQALAVSCIGSCVGPFDSCPTGMSADGNFSCPSSGQKCCVGTAAGPTNPNPTTNPPSTPPGTTGPTGAPSVTGTSGGGMYQNQEKIPGFAQTSSLTEYLQNLYKFGLAIAAILAVVMVGIGAFMYVVTAAGNAGKMADGKDMITNAIYGLILALLTYLIFLTINPDFLSGTLTGSKIEPGYTGSGAGGIPQVAKGCDDKVDQAINKAASDKGFDPSIMKAIVKCGEGCDPNVSKDGHSSCGYTQVTEANRPKCGIGANTSCSYIMGNIDADMACGAYMIKDCIRQKGSSDIREIARCYNASPGTPCEKTTKKDGVNYCDRVQNCK